jgi:hypothetical protein
LLDWPRRASRRHVLGQRRQEMAKHVGGEKPAPAKAMHSPAEMESQRLAKSSSKVIGTERA